MRLGAPTVHWRDATTLAEVVYDAAEAAARAAGRPGCIFADDPAVAAFFRRSHHALKLTDGAHGRPQVRHRLAFAADSCSLQRLIAAHRAKREPGTDWGWRDPGPSAKQGPPTQQWPVRWDAGHCCAHAPGCINPQHIFPQPIRANRATKVASCRSATPVATTTPAATEATRRSSRGQRSTKRKSPFASPRARR